MSTISNAFAAGREARRGNRRRTAVFAALLAAALAVAGFLGRVLPTARQLRSGLLRFGGLGTIVAGIWQWNLVAGLIALGCALLLLEAVGDDDA